MKILLTVNKTYRGFPDSAMWYVHKPLLSLGHDVYLYDTVSRSADDKTYTSVIEDFKPDLIFCIMTGDRTIAPEEPWLEIDRETARGRTKTFNWFCDDTWRFKSFSKYMAKYFTVCSTPERSYLSLYKEAGYDNVIVGNWHANVDYFPKINFDDKDIETSFIGAPTKSRVDFFNASQTDIEILHKLTQEEMFECFSRSKIGINLSINDNDPLKQTQMKQRLFEIPAGAGLLMTQYHAGIEEYFEINKEIITFSSIIEFKEKMKFLQANPKVVRKIATAGHQRFLKEHDSKIRLENILKQIMAI